MPGSILRYILSQKSPLKCIKQSKLQTILLSINIFIQILYIASVVYYQAVKWSVVAVDARPTVPPQERAAVGLQGFSLLYTQCWKPLAEHRPGAELVLKWLEALNDIKATKSTVSVDRRSRLLRIYAGSMLSGVEYKTMRVLPLTTGFHLIVKLLETFNLRHVDPNLFSVQLELGTENNLLTLAPEDTLFRLLTSLPWACKPLKARLRPRPGGKLEVHCSCPLQACGATRVQVAVDSKVEQVLEVVLKTKMEERIGGEKLVEVSPNGKRRVLEPEESPYQVRKGNFEKKTCFASKRLPCSDPLSWSASAFNQR